MVRAKQRTRTAVVNELQELPFRPPTDERKPQKSPEQISRFELLPFDPDHLTLPNSIMFSDPAFRHVIL